MRHPVGSVGRVRHRLPWANEPDAQGQVRMWAVHNEIARQSAEWTLLRERYPGVPLVVAGDFNQDRDGTGWYGSRAVRDALTEQLQRAGLTILTDADVVSDGLLHEHHLIDHIAATDPLHDGASLSCWDVRDEQRVRLSDHPTIAVDVAPTGMMTQ